MMSDLPQVIVKAKHAQPFYARHPWVFAGSVGETKGELSDGDEVDLVSHTGSFIARGLYNSQSKIRVRLYSWDHEQRLDRDFWRSRIRQAIALRHETLHLNRSGFTPASKARDGVNDSPHSAYRVIFGEADQLSGLVVDRFADALTVQFTSLGIANRKDIFTSILAEEFQPRCIILRTEKGMNKLEGIAIQDGLIWGELPDHGETTFEENGLVFHVNLTQGQKTGYYLDQRDNRLAVAKFCHGKRVLDTFCYSGGFGLYAARAGASQVISVDASDDAIALAKRNAAANQLTIEHAIADIFDDMQQRVEEKQQFDVVILDPPKFARDRKSVPNAIRGYRRLHSLALKLLSKNGILVSCCCSGLVSLEEFEDVIAQCAVQAKRPLQILERRGPAADHPISFACRESGYLKCLISRVGEESQ